MSICTAKSDGKRIELIIGKNDEGYVQFKKVLDFIEQDGVQSWYGNITNENGEERLGLVITSKIVSRDVSTEEELQELSLMLSATKVNDVNRLGAIIERLQKLKGGE